MRTTLLVAVSILAVAFAGCTEEPPTGEFSSTGNALAMAGSIKVLETQDYNNPYPQTEPTAAACQQNGVDGSPLDPCTYPKTVMTLNFTSLPDPAGKTYAIKFNSDAAGTQEDIATLTTMPMDGGWQVHDYTFDNTEACSASKDNAACNKANTYDSVQLYLGDILVGQAPLTQGGAFEFDAGLLGSSFTGSYSGRDVTLTVSGLGNYTYEAWLVSTDDAGVVTHDESFPVVNGETTFTATKTINQFSNVHIHVAGTKLNVAVGAIA